MCQNAPGCLECGQRTGTYTCGSATNACWLRDISISVLRRCCIRKHSITRSLFHCPLKILLCPKFWTCCLPGWQYAHEGELASSACKCPMSSSPCRRRYTVQHNVKISGLLFCICKGFEITFTSSEACKVVPNATKQSICSIMMVQRVWCMRA